MAFFSLLFMKEGTLLLFCFAFCRVKVFHSRGKQLLFSLQMKKGGKDFKENAVFSNHAASSLHPSPLPLTDTEILRRGISQ